MKIKCRCTSSVTLLSPLRASLELAHKSIKTEKKNISLFLFLVTSPFLSEVLSVKKIKWHSLENSWQLLQIYSREISANQNREERPLTCLASVYFLVFLFDRLMLGLNHERTGRKCKTKRQQRTDNFLWLFRLR